MSDSNTITVGYWSTKGLGAVCRMVVLYSGFTLKAKNYKLQPILKEKNLTYDGSEWHDNDKIELKKRNSLINLPYIELNLDLLDLNKKKTVIFEQIRNTYSEYDIVPYDEEEYQELHLQPVYILDSDLKGRVMWSEYDWPIDLFMEDLYTVIELG